MTAATYVDGYAVELWETTRRVLRLPALRPGTGQIAETSSAKPLVRMPRATVASCLRVCARTGFDVEAFSVSHPCHSP